MEDRPEFTPRNVAKYLVQGTIQIRVTKLAKNVISDHTRFERDSTPVGLAANVIGWGVSARLKPHTDKMVDKTADFVIVQRVKLQDKKSKKKNNKDKKKD